MTFFYNQIFEPGPRLMDGSLMNRVEAHPQVSSDNAVAAAGTTAATARRLAAVINVITTAGAGATGVMLPVANPGTIVYVFNQGGAAAVVYGWVNEAGTITNLVDAAASVPLANGARCGYYCYQPGNWVSALLGAVSA